MVPQHVMVGVLVCLLCAAVLVRERLILTTTRKGQRLVTWFGPDAAPWVLRGLAVLGICFGLLLAAGIVRPIQWN